MGRILVIDDDPSIRRLVSHWSESMGHICEAFGSITSGIKHIRQYPVDIVFLDVMLPEGNGVDHVPMVLEANPECAIVILSGHSDPRCIEKAFDSGVQDYILKPIEKGRLYEVIDSLLRQKDKAAIRPAIERSGIIGESSRLNRCIEQMGLAARMEGNLLITGETGTGKELFARALHRNSTRAENRYVVVDCTNLPDNLAESLLFGHDRGAFTGADRTKKGLFEHAHKGTLFLDEIGDLSLNVQKSLLRVLQEKTFRPLSSSKEVNVDFRLVAATNCNLYEMVEKGLFRRDLYYRLKTFSIELPPLRSRNGDIKLLAKNYVKSICKELGRKPLKIGSSFMEALYYYEWPGNVREFVNVIRVSVYKAVYEDELTFFHLPQNLRSRKVVVEAEDKGGMIAGMPQAEMVAEEAPDAAESGDNGNGNGNGNNGGWNGEVESLELQALPVDNAPDFPDLKHYRKNAINQVEETYLRHLAVVSENSVKKACRISGLSRTRLYELLQKHNLSLRA